MRCHRCEIVSSLLLVLLTLAAYAGVAKCDFISLDDPFYFSDNLSVQNGLTLPGIRYAWTTFDCGNYHPLTWLSLELDASLYGLNPTGPHITNLVLHLANAVLLLMVLHRMTGKLWPSAFVAALFALHPMHVESVAWISERKDVLSTFFLILTLMAYERYAANLSVARYSLVFVMLALGLLAKPMLVSVPCLMLLLDYWPLRRLRRASDSSHSGDAGDGEADLGSSRYLPRSFTGLVCEKLPLLALAIVSSVVTLFAQGSGGAYKWLAGLPILIRLGNAIYAYAWYLGKTFWPTDLTIIYPHPQQGLSLTMVGTGLLALIGVPLLVFWPSPGRAPRGVGWLWFLGSLVPVIGIVQVGIQAYADRYVYVPHIGLFVLVAFGTDELLSRSRACRVVLAVAASAVVAVFAGLTRQQVTYWRNTEALWQHSLACIPDNWIAHFALGDLRFEEKEFEEAVQRYSAVVRQRPRNVEFQLRLGETYERLQRFREAQEHYEVALRLDPKNNGIHRNLHSLYVRQGDLDPDNPVSRNKFGLALARLGETEDAVKQFSLAVDLDPKFTDARNNLGLALSLLNRNAEAKAQFLSALELAPDFASSHFNLATLLQKEGDTAGAKEHLAAAVRLDPDDSEARERLRRLQRSESERSDKTD